jgi:hypothetical protein
MTAKGYTSVSLVEGEVLFNITASSTPNTSQVTVFIKEAEGEIDELTNSSYTPITVTDEVVPYTDNEALYYGGNLYGGIRYDSSLSTKSCLYLTYNNRAVRPILSISSLAKNNANNTSADSWSALNLQAGSGGDFILDKQNGMIIFLKDPPIFGTLRALKWSGTYGYSTIPVTVNQLATKMVAKRVLLAKAMKSQMSGQDDISLESISITKGITRTVVFLKYLDEEILRLKSELMDTFKTEIV